MRKSNHDYFDDKHFPMGFRRSGDFTINEAKLLTEYGLTLKQLSSGCIDAESEQEQHFIKVISGEAGPINAIEDVWLKYLKVISPKRYVNIYGHFKHDEDINAVNSEGEQ